ncbi:Crp/Fnr family transcriptional regulator [Vibrio sp. DW001]|uniref:Crp/Fnr family transcriptional regulator n=1 Tax=Vibrio sp. DW001 TaxID=2912315 RepID=UPI0023B1489A|nr:Crp/Fnr family transcriptional regulator [Vibrio sp. DW001]WED25915.1 Crp/Fnr family transcriptional regulator [Vibrio sp. DW001]
MQLNLLAGSNFEKHWRVDINQVRTIIESCVVRKELYQAGDYLLNQGSQLKSLLLVEQGSISMGYNASNGKSFQIGVIDCDGHIFGELEFFTNLECQIDILAVETLEAYIIDIEKLRACLLKETSLALFFAYYIALDYQNSVDVYLSRLVYSISYNIAFELYQSHEGVASFSGFSKQYLEAERFGTTDRVYRRALQKLEELGLIERAKDGIKIADYDKLKDYIDNSEPNHG